MAPVLIRELGMFDNYYIRRLTRGGRGGGLSPALFQKLEKSALICEKKMSWLWSSMGKVFI